MKVLVACLGAALAACGAPAPRHDAAVVLPHAVAPIDSASPEPVPGRVFTIVPPEHRSSDTAVVGGTEASRIDLDEPDAGCVTAEWVGTIGNCIAPSIRVHDACGGWNYALTYNDCAQGVVDTTGLVQPGKHPVSVLRTSAGRPSPDTRSEAVAIRGAIHTGAVYATGADFDVQIDFPSSPSSGKPLTVHLVGRTSR